MVEKRKGKPQSGKNRASAADNSRRKMVRLFLFEIIFMLALGVSAYFISLSEKIGYEELDENIFIGSHAVQTAEESKTAEETETAEPLVVEAGAVDYDQAIAHYRNILLVGVDARDQKSMTKGANADVLMLVNINERTGEIKLISVLRDTLLRLVDGGTYHPDRMFDKANAQNCYTNISDTVSMINRNLDLNIREYVVVNWMAAAKIVDTIGGIEVNIENEDILKYLNGYLAEVNQTTGIFAPQVKQTGLQVLSGTQAVSFCRIRYAGLMDYGRTNNQREMIVKVLEKMKTLLFEKPAAVMTAVNQAAESVVTNLTLKEIGALAFQAGTFHIGGHCAFPFEYLSGSSVEAVTQKIGGIRDILVADDLEKNVVMLHQYLYGDAAADYTAPDYVKEISTDIRQLLEGR